MPRSEPTTPTRGDQAALERIAAALEAEAARREIEAANKAEENRRVRSAVALLIYVLPLLYLMTSLKNPTLVREWTSDAVKLGVLVTLSATLIAAIVQAVRVGAYGVGGLTAFVAIFVAFAVLVVATSGKEEYVLFGLFYVYLGVRLIYAQVNTMELGKRLLQRLVTAGHDTYLGRLLVHVSSMLPVLSVVPLVFFEFTHSWNVGNLAAAMLAVVAIGVFAWFEYRNTKMAAGKPRFASRP
jgi:hypothetical protein